MNDLPLSNEDRITQLEAGQLAMMYVLRALLPHIPVSQVDACRLLTTAHDAMDTHMQKMGDAKDFQQCARASFDYLVESIY